MMAEQQQANYSQLSPCRHLAITDTPLLQTDIKSPAKTTMKCIEITLATQTNICIVLLSLQWTPAVCQWKYFEYSVRHYFCRQK